MLPWACGTSAGRLSLSPTRPIFGSIDVTKPNQIREICCLLNEMIHFSDSAVILAKQTPLAHDLQTAVPTNIPIIYIPIFTERPVVNKTRLIFRIEKRQFEAVVSS